MAGLTREQILDGAKKAKIGQLPLVVPELGGTIFVRGMSGKERDKFEEGLRIRKGSRAGQSDLLQFRAKLACKVIVSEDGVRLLNDGPDDITILGDLPAGVLDRIIAKCTDQSGLAQEEVADMGNDFASQETSVATS